METSTTCARRGPIGSLRLRWGETMERLLSETDAHAAAGSLQMPCRVWTGKESARFATLSKTVKYDHNHDCVEPRHKSLGSCNCFYEGLALQERYRRSFGALLATRRDCISGNKPRCTLPYQTRPLQELRPPKTSRLEHASHPY